MAPDDTLGKGAGTGDGPLGPPGPPTCDQAGRFFALLVDMGYADALDRLHQSRAPAAPAVDGTRPASLAEVAGVAPAPEPAENAADEPVVRINLGDVFREVGHHGAYPRLAACMWDVTEAEGGRVPVEVLANAFPFFAVACASPLQELGDFVLGWA